MTFVECLRNHAARVRLFDHDLPRESLHDEPLTQRVKENGILGRDCVHVHFTLVVADFRHLPLRGGSHALQREKKMAMRKRRQQEQHEEWERQQKEQEEDLKAYLERKTK